MLHAFSFERGRVAYANRFLRSSAYRAWKREGRIRFSELASWAGSPTATCRSSGSADNSGRSPSYPCQCASTRRRYALWAWMRTCPPAGWAPPTHHDPRTGDRFGYEIELVPPTALRIVSHRNARRQLAWISQSAPGYLHSFALTPRYVVVLAQPFTFDLARFLRPDRGRSSPTTAGTPPSRCESRSSTAAAAVWSRPPRWSRSSSSTTSTPSSGMGKVVLDVCAYPDASIMDALYLKRLRRGRKVPRAGLRRIEVDPARRRATQRDLVEPNFELPRVDYDTPTDGPTATPSASACADRTAGSSTSWSRPTSGEGRRSPGMTPGPFPASRSSSAAPGGGGTTPGWCSRCCSTPGAAARRWWCWTLTPWRRSRGRRCRTTFPSASTGCTRGSRGGLRDSMPADGRLRT